MRLWKETIFILAISLLFGIVRKFTLEDFPFIAEKPAALEPTKIFQIPSEMTEPLIVNLEQAEVLFNNPAVLFVDAREVEEFELGHIPDAINIPFDYFEEYDAVLDSLGTEQILVVYCSGVDCSLSLDLGEFVFYNKGFKRVFLFEGGLAEWQDAGLRWE